MSAYQGFRHLQAGGSGDTLVQPEQARCVREGKIYKSIFPQAVVATVRNQYLFCAPGMEQETMGNEKVSTERKGHTSSKQKKLNAWHLHTAHILHGD